MINSSLESIDFQSPVFFRELAATYKVLRQLKKEDIPGAEETFILSKIIKHHTNLSIAFDFGDEGPAIVTPEVNKNNVLLNEFRRIYTANGVFLNKIAEANGKLRGMVNLSTGKVSGVFAEMQATIYMPVAMLVSPRYSDEELAAITLHEIGHDFVYMEYITRTVTTNQALSALQNELFNSKSPAEREAVFINFKKAVRISPEELQELNTVTDKKVIESVVITAMVDQSRSELGNNIYDSTSWEYLADAYATRYHAGKDIVTALDKIYRDYGNISFRNGPTYLLYEAFKLLLLMGSIWTLTLVIVPILLMAMDGANSDYDNPEVRFKRVRNEILQNLKNPKLNKADAIRLQQDIDLIDNVLKEVNDRRQFIGVLWDWVSTSARRDRNYTLLQQQLETIANNDLYLKANELKLAL